MRLLLFTSILFLIFQPNLNAQKTDYYINEAYKTFDETFEASKAIVYIDSALTIEPNNAQLYYVRGDIQSLENPFDGMKDFNKSLALDSSNADAYSGIGNAHQMKGEWEEAKPYIIKAYDLKPDYWKTIERGRICDEPMEQLEYFQKALLLEDRDEWVVQSEISDVYVEMKDYANALIHYELAFSNPLGEFGPHVYENCGDAYLEVGKKNMACEKWNFALQEYAFWGEPTETLQQKIDTHCN